MGSDTPARTGCRAGTDSRPGRAADRRGTARCGGSGGRPAPTAGRCGRRAPAAPSRTGRCPGGRRRAGRAASRGPSGSAAAGRRRGAGSSRRASRLRSSGVSSPARPPMLMPSNGSPAMNRADSARSSGSRPPWTIPNSAWSVPGVGRERPLRPAMGAAHRVLDDGARRAREHRLVEGDRDVRPERLLDRDRVLRREPVDRPVEVALERDPVVVDHPQVAQGHDLEAARVGEDRPVPAHERRAGRRGRSIRSWPGRRYRW